MINFFKELIKRQIYKAVLSYFLVSWLFIQNASYTFPMMQFPEWSTDALIVLFILFFPYAMIKAWYQSVPPIK